MTMMPVQPQSQSALIASARAQRPAVDRSDKYRFFSTEEIVATVESAGFELFRQTEKATRKEEHKGFTKHLLRFRQSDSALARKMGDTIPELSIINSHNGGSSLRVFTGLFRVICLNGLVVGDTWDERIYPHRGNSHTLDDILEDVFGIAKHFDTVADQVQNMQSRIVSQSVREEFARQAALLRWDENQVPLLPDQLLRPKRHEDRGEDAWSVFNRAQENLIKGQTYYSRGRLRKTRAIKGLESDLDINRKLWTLAQDLLV